VNAAPIERRFCFGDAHPNFFGNFFGRSLRSGLGPQVGKKDAIRFYRMAGRSGRYMLRRVIDLRCTQQRVELESPPLSIASRKEERATRADVAAEAFALTNESV
jgi:hypothetical protein